MGNGMKKPSLDLYEKTDDTLIVLCGECKEKAEDEGMVLKRKKAAPHGVCDHCQTTKHRQRGKPAGPQGYSIK